MCFIVCLVTNAVLAFIALSCSRSATGRDIHRTYLGQSMRRSSLSSKMDAGWNRGPGDEARRALPSFRDDVELLVAQFCLGLADARVDSLQLRRAERAHEVRLLAVRAERPLLLGAAAHEVRDGDLGLLFEGRAHLVGEFVHLVFRARRFASRRWRGACVALLRRLALQEALALNTAYWGRSGGRAARNRRLYSAALLCGREPHNCWPQGPLQQARPSGGTT